MSLDTGATRTPAFTFRLERDPSLQRPQRLFFMLFSLLALVAPLYYQQNLGGEGLYLPYNASTWIAALLLTAAGLLLAMRRHSLVTPNYGLALCALPAGLLISGFVTGIGNPSEWLLRLGYVLGGFGFFIALFQFRLQRQHQDMALVLVLCGIMLQALIGWIQLQQLPFFSALVPIASSSQPIAIFQQVNLTASYLATGLPLAIYLATRPGALHAPWLIRILPYCGLVLCSGVLLATGSRVGLLGGALGLLLALAGRRSFLIRHKGVALALSLSLLLGSGFLLSDKVEKGSSAALNKIERLQQGGQADVRFSVYEISLDTIANAPLFGHGLGSFQSAWQEERGEFQDRHPELDIGPRYSHPHNELLFWLVEGGLVAVAGILICAGTVAWRLVRLGSERGLLLAGMLLPIVLHTQVELPFYISSPHWFLLLFLLYLTFSQRPASLNLKLSQAARGLCTGLLLLLPVLGATFLLHTLVANAGIVNYMKNRGQQSAFLQPAIHNLYFSGHATYMMMKESLLIGYRLDDKQRSAGFIAWANDYLQRTPDTQLFYDLAGAYVHIGDHRRAQQALERGLYIYRHNKRLEQALLSLKAGDIDSYLKGLAEQHAERSAQPSEALHGSSVQTAQGETP
ncbi:PglL family O-oligosaccharyltransferase [Marinobacterium rhizophilum]|uniref:O-antigen ligase C-terminal domain-containing protein n=1 Tax=Marinobacterium rhizophilum TaxID=420402 RepID=A0ABY5HLN5_9GAMM|nr:O-antigen ligase family protein [Marinobacterium rhizophilum]UTW13288.1 O-antigen ligase C-terminal domain-containing protein [Marinobacterium rhizophilum]